MNYHNDNNLKVFKYLPTLKTFYYVIRILITVITYSIILDLY
jgi:hypothetical protein